MSHSYSLANLKLGYGETEVLAIDELNIPSGKMIFVIGESGIGKSTFLETVGLMSNTFLSNPEAQNKFEIDGQALDPHQIWEDKTDLISTIRNDKFSFIFQSTNLMPNFTVKENIALASLGRAELEQEKLYTLLDALNLDPAIAEKFPMHISGGQRQRIAFIRALMKDFSILLADEPTGNLDPENAYLLFSILKKQLNAEGKTAIVVSHHLDLADEFADEVLTIKRDTPDSISYITSSNS